MTYSLSMLTERLGELAALQATLITAIVRCGDDAAVERLLSEHRNEVLDYADTLRQLTHMECPLCQQYGPVDVDTPDGPVTCHCPACGVEGMLPRDQAANLMQALCESVEVTNGKA